MELVKVPSESEGSTGAESLVSAATEAGIQVCFANPGTTEMPIVSALDSASGLRAVLGLQENVCTGAADGYARMADRPAMTLLHLGPGLANGLANLHNARRAHSPIVNVIGDHTSWHLPFDAPLTSDIEALARTVGTVRTVKSRETIGDDVHDAVRDALCDRVVSSLVVPADFQQERSATSGGTASGGGADRRARTDDLDPGAVERVATLLAAEPGAVVLLLGASALTRVGQRAAGRIAAATGATLYSETFPARTERGGGLPQIDRLPYFPEAAIQALAGRHVVLVGAERPVAYFGYEGIPSLLAPPERVHRLSAPHEDGEALLVALAERLGAQGALVAPAAPKLPGRDVALDGAAVGAALAALVPEQAIVSVEGGTCGYPFFAASHGARAHTSLTNTGGAIGQGLPVALGAAIAAPDRQVVALQSDGSGLYTAQALWTMARERCDVVVLIAANHVYNVLRTELSRHDHQDLGHQAGTLTSLADPSIDWLRLSTGFGVPAERARTVGELADSFSRAVDAGGPHLIEMAL